MVASQIFKNLFVQFFSSKNQIVMYKYNFVVDLEPCNKRAIEVVDKRPYDRLNGE